MPTSTTRPRRLTSKSLSHSSFLQHSGRSRPSIAAWIGGLSSPADSSDPAAPPPAKRRRILREVGSNFQSSNSHCPDYACLMSEPPTKHSSQRTRASGDDDDHSTRSRTRRGGRAGSKAIARGRIVAVVEDNPNIAPEEISAASEYDVVSEAPSLPPRTVTSSKGRSPTRSSSPKKRTVAKREDLALLSPTIEFRSFIEVEDWGIQLPQSVKELWDRCDARRSTPPGTNPSIPLSPRDLLRIEDTLKDAFEMAQAWRTTTTEPHWMSVVVGPILHLIRKLSVFQDNDKTSNKNITVLDITPIEISPAHLCPYSTTSFYPDLDKRIDYAIGLSSSPPTLQKLRNAAYKNGTKSINQTSTFCNFVPMFVNVEVKRRHVGKDPAIQLAAWIAAEFRKRLIEGWMDTGQGHTQGNGSTLGSPVFAIEVEADAWLLYVVTAQLKPPKARKSSRNAAKEDDADAAQQDFDMFFLGPMRLGDTYSLDDAERLVENLCDICMWGQTEFRKWWEETVLEACEG